MQIKKLCLLACLTVSLALGGTELVFQTGSTSARSTKVPAEFPPSSFKAKQYVDSRGCVYIRAGFSGQVSWIPRVNRKRKHYCSSKNASSLTSAQLASIHEKRVSVPTQEVAVAPKKTVKLAAAPKVAVPKTVVRQVQPARQPSTLGSLFSNKKQRQIARVVTPTAISVARPLVQQPQYIAPTQPRVIARASQQTRIVRRQPNTLIGGTGYNTGNAVNYVYNNGPRTNVLVGGTGYSVVPAKPLYGQVYTQAQPTTVQQQGVRQVNRSTGFNWFGSNDRLAIRRGSQAVHPSVYAQRAYSQTANGGTHVVVQQRVQPRTFITQQGGLTYVGTGRGTTADVDPIYGLPTVGTVIDSDITYQGDVQMAQVWGNKTPRRLVTSQRQTSLSLTYQPVTVVQPVAKVRSRVKKASSIQNLSARERALEKAVRKRKAKKRAVQQQVASIQPKAISSSARFIQVATFGVPANANRTIAKFQGQGLPVATGNIKRNGKVLKLVMLGPFSDAANLRVGLSSARAAGFRDAFAIK